MRQVEVLINAPEKAEKLCNILSRHSGTFDIVKGQCSVDGKSILGVYAMDLSEPLTLCIHDESEPVVDEIREFIVTVQP